MSPAAADSSASYRAIENLIAAYAAFTGGGSAISGQSAIEKMLRDVVIVYDDGTPRTKHVTTNIAIEADEDTGTAVSRSYFAVLQALPGLPLQTIAAGRYRDRFERSAGQWHFADRQVHVDLTGDVSRDLRRSESADRPVT